MTLSRASLVGQRHRRLADLCHNLYLANAALAANVRNLAAGDGTGAGIQAWDLVDESRATKRFVIYFTTVWTEALTLLGGNPLVFLGRRRHGILWRVVSSAR